MSEAVLSEEEASAERAVVTLGGRRFVVIHFDRRTVVMDHYLGKMIRRSGVDKVVPMDSDGEGMLAQQAYLLRCQTALLDSGVAHEIIAGFLLPEGKVERDWTPDIARKTAAHIAALDTEGDRDQVLRLSMEAVFGFFRDALARLGSIQRSLLVQSQSAATPSESASARAH
jgi:hypothetical protein